MHGSSVAAAPEISPGAGGALPSSPDRSGKSNERFAGLFRVQVGRLAAVEGYAKGGDALMERLKIQVVLFLMPRPLYGRRCRSPLTVR